MVYDIHTYYYSIYRAKHRKLNINNTPSLNREPKLYAFTLKHRTTIATLKHKASAPQFTHTPYIAGLLLHPKVINILSTFHFVLTVHHS